MAGKTQLTLLVEFVPYTEIWPGGIPCTLIGGVCSESFEETHGI